MTYAYTGEVLLPVTVRTQPGELRVRADWLVCKDICVPESGDFTLTLPKGIPGQSAQAALFAVHDRSVPRPSPWKSTIAPDGTLFVQGPELTPATVTDAWFIPDQAGSDPGRRRAAAVGARRRLYPGSKIAPQSPGGHPTRRCPVGTRQGGHAGGP